PPVVLLTAVPISISGWGVREGAMVACLGLAGVPSEEALSVSLLLGAVSVIVGLAGGVIWLVSPERGLYSADKAAKAADGTPNFQVPNASVDDPVFRAAVPMALHLCADCGHLQILHVGNPEIQYRNYVYTTSLSLGLREHFAGYANDVVSRFGIAPGSLVVELGSNDGSLLGFFKERGMRVLGVDP